MKDIVANIVIEYYSRDKERMRSDILHTQEVVAYTRLIALGEGVPEIEVEMLEIAAWLHDIGCPRSQKIYGNTLPANQQSVGRIVAGELMAQVEGLTDVEKGWIMDVVATHHHLSKAQEFGFMPLFEADLIVNILSGYHPMQKAQMLRDTMIFSESGRRLFKLLIG